MVAIFGIALALHLRSEVKPSMRGVWPSALASSKIARQSAFVQKFARRPPQPHRLKRRVASGQGPHEVSGDRLTPGPGPFVTTLSPEPAHAPKPYAGSWMEEADRAWGLMREGKYAEARIRLENDLNITRSVVYAVPLMDADFGLGDYVAAYKVAAAFISSPSPGQSGFYYALLARRRAMRRSV